MITIWQCLLASLKGFKMAPTLYQPCYLLPLSVLLTWYLEPDAAFQSTQTAQGCGAPLSIQIVPYLSAELSKSQSALFCTDLCRSCSTLHLPNFTLCTQQALTFRVSFPSRYKLGFLSEQSHFPTFMHTCISLKSLNSH